MISNHFYDISSVNKLFSLFKLKQLSLIDYFAKEQNFMKLVFVKYKILDYYFILD